MSTKISQQDAISALWEVGEISYILEPPQKLLYNFLRHNDGKITVVKCSRRLGKSTSAVILATETCIKNPGSVVKYLAPRKDEMVKSLIPTFEMLFKDAPPGLRLHEDVKYSPSKGTFTFPNGSEIQISPAENNHYQSLRGGKCHLAIVDEAGFIDKLKDAVMSVLLPTTNTTQGRILVLSTPPADAEHYFSELVEIADNPDKNNLFTMTIDEYFEIMDKYNAPCTRFPKSELQVTIEAMGGRQTEEFRREYLCENISSSETRVVPEFTLDLKKEICIDVPTPDFYDAYVSMDVGVKDMTVILFAYYDFLRERVVIQDEFWLQGKDVITETIADGINKKERELWIDPVTTQKKEPYIRVSDNDLRLIQDLIRLHKLVFVPTEKHNKAKYINELRQRIAAREIIISPKCVKLINHLDYAQWNSSRKDFKRTKDGAHADGVAALMYLIRNIVWGKNPYPNHYQFRDMGANILISPKHRETRNQFQEVIKEKLKMRSSLQVNRNRYK